MGCIYQRGRTWWIKYSRAGRGYYESSGSRKHADAKRLLRLHEGDGERGLPVTPKVGRLTFEDAAEAFLTDYRVNRRRSYTHAKRRVDLGLTPWFQGRRMVQITPDEVQRYVEHRQTAGAANATINRELAALKRMFSLAIKRGRLLHGPYIPLLHEDNVRQGFFERQQFEDVRAHLPRDLQGLVTLAYYTGWWMRSELLPLKWAQIDRRVGTIRLEPGTTKNRDGRTVAYLEIDELREMMDEQWRRHEALHPKGILCPWLFFRGRGMPVKSLARAWRSACRRAGCPGRVPHDLRRTAVRNLERAGVPRKVAMTIVGHRTEAMYRRYDIVTESDLHAAAVKLNSAASTVTKSVTVDTNAAS